jgi:hypothetical protein
MLKLESLVIEKLIPYARNSRTHSDEQVAQMTSATTTWEGTAGNDSVSITANQKTNETNYAEINTYAGNDTVALRVNATAATRINLGDGNDTLTVNLASRALVAGAQYNGGDGTWDALLLGGNGQTYDLTGKDATSLFTNFEHISLGATGAQPLNLSLANVFEMTEANTIPLQLAITSTNGQGDKLNLSLNGAAATAGRAAGSSFAVNDSNGASATKTVAADNPGGDGQTQVTLANGRVYDIYQYDYNGNVLDLLIDQTILVGNRTFVI